GRDGPFAKEQLRRPRRAEQLAARTPTQIENQTAQTLAAQNGEDVGQFIGRCRDEIAEAKMGDLALGVEPVVPRVVVAPRHAEDALWPKAPPFQRGTALARNARSSVSNRD